MTVNRSQADIERMRALYRSGLTLQEVGDEFGITREAVRQHIPEEPARRRRLKRERELEERRRRDAERRERRAWVQRHGALRRYQMGCRCAACRQAHNARQAYQRKKRSERLRRGEVDPPHGRNTTYSNYDCRCELCTTAWSAYCARLARQRRGDPS